MIVKEPTIETRDEQHFVGIRTQVPMSKFEEIIPQYIDETMTWLDAKGIAPVGAPVMRYHVIDMDGDMDVEIGWCVGEPVSGDDRVSTSVIPAGKYGTLIYTDVTRGIEGNAALIKWAEGNDIEWDAWDSPEGHAFRSRLEFMLDGPEDDPDPTKWRTEVAIRISDGE